MKTQLFDFYEKYRILIWVTVLFLLIVFFYRDWLALVAIIGGLGAVYGAVAYLGDEHPLRDVVAVGALLAWIGICWQTFDFIVKHESTKAQIFCGKIIQSENKSAPRQMNTYYYLIENQQGMQKSFQGHDYLGEPKQTICLHYIPKEKSVFFHRDYVLKIERQ